MPFWKWKELFNIFRMCDYSLSCRAVLGLWELCRCSECIWRGVLTVCCFLLCRTTGIWSSPLSFMTPKIWQLLPRQKETSQARGWHRTGYASYSKVSVPQFSHADIREILPTCCLTYVEQLFNSIPCVPQKPNQGQGLKMMHQLYSKIQQYSVPVKLKSEKWINAFPVSRNEANGVPPGLQPGFKSGRRAAKGKESASYQGGQRRPQLQVIRTSRKAAACRERLVHLGTSAQNVHRSFFGFSLNNFRLKL